MKASVITVPNKLWGIKFVERPDVPKYHKDVKVFEVLEADGSARVIVVGRTQLFAPVGGLEQFQAEHAGEDRLALRREVVATLKRNAIAEQAAILRALGRSSAMCARIKKNILLTKNITKFSKIFIYYTG